MTATQPVCKTQLCSTLTFNLKVETNNNFLNPSYKLDIHSYIFSLTFATATAFLGSVPYLTNICIFCITAVRYSCILTLHNPHHLALSNPYLFALANDLSIKCCLVLTSFFDKSVLAKALIQSSSSCLRCLFSVLPLLFFVHCGINSQTLQSLFDAP